jgi:vacuolar iron transporter family protein
MPIFATELPGSMKGDAVTVMELFVPRRQGHLGHRAGWLRAAVLGSNDGLVSTSSLMVGVAAAGPRPAAVLTAGLAGLAAGAMAMAAGEWVSVSSQVDVERADLALELQELTENPEAELEELTGIFEQRGLPRALAEQVAVQLSKGDVLAVHAREELGHHEVSRARPLQAALASAASFTIGGLVPILGLLGPSTGSARIGLIIAVTLVGLAVAGWLGARVAGTAAAWPTVRVLLGGGAAMLVTALVGHLVGSVAG